MAADVPLLPLPPARLVIKHDRGPISETQPFWNRRDVSDYARTYAAHVTAAKDAEIEALRAEVAKLRNLRADAIHECALANVRAEQLAEALREATVALDIAGRPGNAKRFRAALNAAQENDDA